MTNNRKAELEADLKELLWCQSNVDLILDPLTCPPQARPSIERLARMDGISYEDAARICAQNTFHLMQDRIDALRTKISDLQ